MLKMLCALFAISVPAIAQVPSTETLTLSLKTISKALVGCRETYTRANRGGTQPLLREVVGIDDYAKTLSSLGHAEKITAFLISHPDRISGKALVIVLSTSDDFSIGVGSTRTEILEKLVEPATRLSPSEIRDLVPTAAALNNCQKQLFNAGDDYVDLVARYIGAEDDALMGSPKSSPHP